jgi:hypothetical protein
MRISLYFSVRLSLLAALLVSGLAACSSGWSDDDERFVTTYTEILVVREMTPDTTAANPIVRGIITSHGYTWDSFREQYQSNYISDAEKFRAMLDSARNRAERKIAEQSGTKDTTGATR